MEGKNFYIEINTESKFSWEPVDSFPGFYNVLEFTLYMQYK